LVGTSRVAGCLYRCHTALKSKAEKKSTFLVEYLIEYPNIYWKHPPYAIRWWIIMFPMENHHEFDWYTP
jgi:hypothetical protein